LSADECQSTLWAVKNIVRCIYRPEREDGSTH
jgi:hypothetical protein